MAKYLNHYGCSECGHHWTDEWSCMCDDRCPNCNTSISPYFSEELEAETEEETEESFEERLRRISDEVKADMKAGRYRHGQLRPEISAKTPQPQLLGFDDWQKKIMRILMDDSMGTMTGRFTRPTPAFHEMYGGRVIDTVIMDEWSSIGKHMWMPITPREPTPDLQDWEHPIPKRGPETPPSDAKRQQLRAKRKRKK